MGYTWEGMTKISYEEAIEMWYRHGEGPLYRLYDDDTEGMVRSFEEIVDHNEYGGEFGYE